MPILLRPVLYGQASADWTYAPMITRCRRGSLENTPEQGSGHRSAGVSQCRHGESEPAQRG